MAHRYARLFVSCSLALFINAQAEKGTRVSGYGFQFSYPPSIANIVSMDVSPWNKLENASDHPAGKVPEHAFFRFSGPYQELYERLKSKNLFSFAPEIHFYPIEGFKEVFKVEPKYVSKLEKDLATFGKLLDEKKPKPKYLQDTLFMSYPFGDVSETFLAKPHKLKFKHGQGVSFLTEMFFEPTPFLPEQLIYVFQGLSKNQKYLITATFPIQPKVEFPKENTEEFLKKYSQDPKALSEYLQKVKTTLESMSDDQFEPSIETLDDMASSIEIR